MSPNKKLGRVAVDFTFSLTTPMSHFLLVEKLRPEGAKTRQAIRTSEGWRSQVEQGFKEKRSSYMKN